METILQQLFDGKINPSEQYRPELQQYKDLVRKQNEEYKQFSEQLNKLDPHLEKQFQAILDRQLEEIPLEMAQLFINGFKLGARITAESLVIDNNFD